MSLGDPDPSSVTNRGDTARLTAASRSPPTARLALEALGLGRAAPDPAVGSERGGAAGQPPALPSARDRGRAELAGGGRQALRSLGWSLTAPPPPRSSSFALWRGRPWSPHPTPAPSWCRPDVMGHERGALRPRNPILAPRPRGPRPRGGGGAPAGRGRPSVGGGLPAGAGVDHRPPPRRRGRGSLAPGARLALAVVLQQAAQ